MTTLVDYKDDIEITRKIERGKGSSYFVNAKPARAKDVQLLFADSATGARSSSMVSQGRIGAIVGAKPNDRRVLLEEAANITGLHSRRHEAELRLRGAETNLERLDDVIVGLTEQRDSLRKQARQASRYRSVAERIRKAEAQLLLVKWTANEASLSEFEANLHRIRLSVAEKTELAARSATGRAEIAATLPPLARSVSGSLTKTTMTILGSLTGARPANHATWRWSLYAPFSSTRAVPVLPATRYSSIPERSADECKSG